MVKDIDILRSFLGIGEESDVSARVNQSLAQLTCQLYGQKGTIDVNQARLKILSPCKSVLELRIK